MADNGRLTLLSKTNNKQQIFEPVKNVLNVGSSLLANACLSGLKSVAFNINVDTFGREITTAKKSADARSEISKRRSSFIPVKENRTSELRRASIVRSMSESNSGAMQFRTPNKSIPSKSMTKSVGAIIRSESRDHGLLQAARRKSLASSFPKMIDQMELFNVVTEDVRCLGFKAYAAKKFGTTNIPRTPTRKPKISLQSELNEIRQNLNKNATESTSSEAPKDEEADAKDDMQDDESLDTSSSIIIVTDSEIEDEEESIISIHDTETDEFSPNVVESKTAANDKPDDIKKSQDLKENEDQTETETISTPSKRPSSIRKRRNSRLCSLTECCSSTNVTPTKSSFSNDAVLTPRSILMKTPKAFKTPRKTVRILDTILHEEEEESSKKSDLFDEEKISLNSDNEQGPSVVCEHSPVKTDGDKTVVADLFASDVVLNATNPEDNSNDEKNDSTEKPVLLNSTFDLEYESEISSKASQLCNEANLDPSVERSYLQNDDEIKFQTETATINREESNIFDSTFDIDKNNEIIEDVEQPNEEPEELSEMQNMVTTPNELIHSCETLEMIKPNGSSDLNQSHETKTTDEFFNTPKSLDKTNLVGVKELLKSPSNLDQAFDTIDMQELLNSPNTLDKTNLVGVKELLKSSSDLNQTIDTRGMKELLNSPKSLDKTNLVGVKELLKSPSDLDQTIDTRGMKELLNSPKPLDKTNLVGVKELLKSPGDLDQTIDTRGMKELLTSPKSIDKTNLVGVKELLKSPSDLDQTIDTRGMKELLNSPKPLDKTNLVGVKELLKSPSDLNKTIDTRGMKELLNSPKPLDKTNLVGVKELLKSPSDLDQTIDTRGMKELLNSPKPLDKTNLVGVKELLESPSDLNETHEVESYSDVLTSSQDNEENSNTPRTLSDSTSRSKKHRISFHYDSRASLIRLINNQLNTIDPQISVPHIEVNNDLQRNIEPQNVESQNIGLQNVKPQNVELQSIELKDVESKNDETMNVGSQNVVSQKTESQNAEFQNFESQNDESMNSELQNVELQNIELQNIESNNVESQNNESQQITELLSTEVIKDPSEDNSKTALPAAEEFKTTMLESAAPIDRKVVKKNTRHRKGTNIETSEKSTVVSEASSKTTLSEVPVKESCPTLSTATDKRSTRQKTADKSTVSSARSRQVKLESDVANTSEKRGRKKGSKANRTSETEDTKKTAKNIKDSSVETSAELAVAASSHKEDTKKTIKNRKNITKETPKELAPSKSTRSSKRRGQDPVLLSVQDNESPLAGPTTKRVKMNESQANTSATTTRGRKKYQQSSTLQPMPAACETTETKKSTNASKINFVETTEELVGSTSTRSTRSGKINVLSPTGQDDKSEIVKKDTKSDAVTPAPKKSGRKNAAIISETKDSEVNTRKQKSTIVETSDADASTSTSSRDRKRGGLRSLSPAKEETKNVVAKVRPKRGKLADDVAMPSGIKTLPPSSSTRGSKRKPETENSDVKTRPKRVKK
ncbi:hypothetical protein Bhyg_15446 [Pseudolycoriella hygida]|uniref:Uncharacterized protein n=1 Tax=Pseudolycoriella hygida TaxID=35572 RepID=A0A9Q0RY89_9DIPT|nr:hypothetical protein Bhyg_15446 [Pseudolycoriella hygida]